MKAVSISLTVLGVLLVLGSMWTLLGGEGPVFVEVKTKVDEQTDPAIRSKVERVVEETRKAKNSLVVRIASLASKVVGFFGLIAGIGVVLRRNQARQLAQVQAVVGIATWAYGAFLSPVFIMPKRLIEAVIDAPYSPIERQRVQLMWWMGTLSPWVGLLLVVGYAAFVVWFLERPAVKAQFISKTTNR